MTNLLMLIFLFSKECIVLVSYFADDLPVYMTYVPVSIEELIDHLKVEKTLCSILEIEAPRIFYDIKTEGEKIGWNRKNNL